MVSQSSDLLKNFLFLSLLTDLGIALWLRLFQYGGVERQEFGFTVRSVLSKKVSTLRRSRTLTGSVGGCGRQWLNLWLEPARSRSSKFLRFSVIEISKSRSCLIYAIENSARHDELVAPSYTLLVSQIGREWHIIKSLALNQGLNSQWWVEKFAEIQGSAGCQGATRPNLDSWYSRTNSHKYKAVSLSKLHWTELIIFLIYVLPVLLKRFSANLILFYSRGISLENISYCSHKCTKKINS